MNLRYLRYFIAVAEEMNFTRAAERLYTVQPSLSRQIRCLEEIVGATLFYRDKHKLELTAAGRIFLEESRAMLRQVDHAIAIAREGALTQAGKLSIGFNMGTENRIFSRLVPVLRQRFPEIQLSYHAMTEAKLHAALEDQQIHLAFLPGPVAIPGVKSEVLFLQKVVAVVPSHHPLAKLKRIPVASLAAMPAILPAAADHPTSVKYMHSIARSAGVRFTSTAEYDNVLSAMHAVSLGIGFTLVPEDQRDLLPGGIVARALDLDPQPMLELSIAYRKDHKLPALLKLLSCIREAMKEPGAIGEAKPKLTKLPEVSR